MPRIPRPTAGAVALAAISALGVLGAVGATARQRDLGDSLQRVQPGLRAPLLVVGRGRVGEPVAPEDVGSVLAGRPATVATRAVFPRGLGRRTVIPEGGEEVPVWLYERETASPEDEAGRAGSSDALRPAVVWIHGGGYVGGDPAQDHGLCNLIARRTHGLVVSVDYRRAPQHPYPAALEDCWSGLTWVHEHAKELGVDPSRVAVGGSSAGGGLAAALTQRARDEGLPLAFQLLVSPLLDDAPGAGGVEVPGLGEFVWTARSNAEGWAAYLGHPAGEPDERPWAVPARAQDLSGLPDAWIGVGDLDLFLDEDLAYAERLRGAGAEVDVRVEPGMYHGADYCTWSASMRAFRESGVDALAQALRRVRPGSQSSS